jgi:signal transduction histidine kinase
LKQIPPIIGRARSLNALIDETIRVVRDIAARMRPAALDMGGMSSLEWLVEEFVRRSGVDCSLDVSDERIELSDDYMTAIFRIVQESLTNVARHAEATRVNIAIRRQAKSIQLEISDNGKGFNTGLIKPSSFGLIGMRERVLMLGGEMAITSKPGSGTTVKVGIPIRNEGISHD